MAEIVELEQVEKLVEQLSPAQQLKLVATICEHLSNTSTIEQMESNMEIWQQKRLQLAEKLLAEVDDIEDDSQGESDAAEDIRRLREERDEKICQSDA
jgi:hypothetical protein